MRLTPEQEAAYALDYGLSRADLKPHVQIVYDRLLEERRAHKTRPRAAGRLQARATWQGSPPRPRWQTRWPLGLLLAGLSGVVVAVIVGAFGGSDPGDATNLAAAACFLFGLAAVCVAGPALLYRRYRARRVAPMRPRPVPSPFSPCYRCGYPFTVHSSDALTCPEAGTCHRCGQPLSAHTGYELTCPDSKAAARPE